MLISVSTGIPNHSASIQVVYRSVVHIILCTGWLQIHCVSLEFFSEEFLSLVMKEMFKFGKEGLIERCAFRLRPVEGLFPFHQ